MGLEFYVGIGGADVVEGGKMGGDGSGLLEGMASYSSSSDSRMM